MCLCFLILFSSIHLVEIKQIVEEFHQLETNEDNLYFLNNYENKTDPSIKAYVIAVKMNQIEQVKNPMKKYKIFKTNKNLLNSLIEKNENNIHLHYIRLLLQENTPDFLGYKNYIEIDKKILKKLMTNKQNDYLNKYIYKNTSL